MVFFGHTLSRVGCLAITAAVLFAGTPAFAQSVDDFERPDAAELGNGWIEKNPQAFGLVGGEANKQGVSSGYRDNVAYRPASESLQDVEVSIEMRLTAGSPGYPQLFARLQTATVANGNSLDGYILYVNNNQSQAILGRQLGSAFVTTLATVNIAPALNTVDDHRLRMRVTGTNPVTLAAFVERWDGSAWIVTGQATVDDGSAQRITNPGVSGFGGFVESSYRYDNFVATDLGSGANPVPTTTALAPSSAIEGDPGFTLSVLGSGFVDDSVVQWNGNARPTTFVAANELQAAITAADIATAGSAAVTVFSPGPGGGLSGAQTFSIDPAVVNNPAPVVTGINPTNVTEGGAGFTLDVQGADFVPGSLVRWNGNDRATTFVAANLLQANITAADIATVGTAQITVFSPAPGGGESAGQTFTIDPATVNNPVPVLATLSPASADAGDPGFTLTLQGADFVPQSTVRWNGADRATTFVSAGQLEATILAGDIVNAGTAAVTVFSPGPGGGTSAAQTFTINDPGPANNPLPVLTSITPGSVTEGNGDFVLTVQGADIVPASVVRWNGSPRPTTYVSASELQATISAADVAAAGTSAVTIFSPAPGGGESAPQTFTVNAGGPVGGFDFVDDFNRANSAAVGNGWIEKSPGAFDLNGNEVRKLGVSSGYRDNIVYRPAAEDVLDVEASIEFELNSGSPGYPQLFTRVQQTNVAQPFTLTGYILYVDDSLTRAVIGRQAGASFLTSLATLNIDPALNTTDTYRMRLRTTGTSPVQLTGLVERWNGAAWETIAQTSAEDNAGQRIVLPGSVGFGGFVESTYTYDNFTRTTLGQGTNPVPVLTSVSPTTAVEGAAGLTLTLQGSGFVPGSIVRWNGADRLTTYVATNQLLADIPASDLATAGSASITVFSPGPGGGTSATQTFTIESGTPDNPVPVLTGLTPNSATEGAAGLTLTVQGTDFVPGSVVRWNGADRTTTFITANQLQATITGADLAVAGPAAVTVFSPAPGGGTSATATFTIDPAGGTNPIPTLNTINPSTATAGDPGFTLTLTGADFIAGSTVRWNGGDRPTTFVATNQLQATVSAADIAAAGTAAVSVFTPAPGGGTSATQTFTIVNGGGGGPTTVAITDVTPESAITGSGAVTLTIVGNDFDNQSVANVDGTPRTTTFVSANELEVVLPAADTDTAGARTVTVTSNGGQTSSPYPFLVVDPSSSYFLDNFNTADSDDIGNNWTEKNPAAFSIRNNEVVGIDTLPLVYRDNIVYRPAAEDRRDVELSFEFVRQDDLGFAQLHARSTRSTITTPNLLESYILYIEDFLFPNGGLSFAIGPDLVDTGECIIRLVPFPSSLQQGDRYRMRFRVTGTNPVLLEGLVDRWDGTVWQEFLYESVVHDNNTQPDPFFCDPGVMPPPLEGAGASGFSKWSNDPENYDNFYWIDLTGAAAVPSITAITPEFVEEDGAGFTLLVTGADFTPGSTVRWNGSNRPTTFVSPTSLQAQIPASDIEAPGLVDVSVFTAPPGGGASGNLTLEVFPAGQQSNPVPSIGGLSPSVAQAGGAGLQVTVSGSGFVQDSVVRWNGSPRPTTFVSSSSLAVDISAADLSTAGSALITVFNPTPGGGVSSASEFTIIQGGEFFDDFNRANSNSLANGWLEKSPPAFRIQNGEVQKLGTSTGYRDNVVYRPAAEERLDSETTVEIVLNSTSPGYPQIYSRIQSATAANPGSLTGYILYVGDRLDRLELGRQAGSGFVTSLQTIWLNENLIPGERYRMRISTAGTSPVVVSASIERLTQSGFVEIGSGTSNDNSAQRIQSPGVAGFSGYVEQGTYTYDNFRARDLN